MQQAMGQWATLGELGNVHAGQSAHLSLEPGSVQPRECAATCMQGSSRKSRSHKGQGSGHPWE